MGPSKTSAISTLNRELRLLSENSSFGYIEAYKSLRTNLEYLLQKDKDSDTGKIVMITSSIPGEGKTNVAINLAYTLAQNNKKVVLIDCDLRAGRIFRYLHVSPSVPDISDVLNKRVTLDAATIYFDTLKFHVLISSDMSDNPSELLSSDEMKKLLIKTSQQYDFVILDTPAVNTVSDTLIVSKYVDGAVLVVSHNSVTRDVVLTAKEKLEKVGSPILGVVLNKYNSKKHRFGHSSSYNYYNYTYSRYDYSSTQK